MASESSAASFPESAAERERRIKERADEARPNVLMTPGQAETINAAPAANIPKDSARYMTELELEVERLREALAEAHRLLLLDRVAAATLRIEGALEPKA